jgi:fucose permease
MPSTHVLLALTVCCAFTFGLLIVLLSSMRSHLASHLNLRESRLDSIWAAMNFVLVPLTLVAGILIDVGDVRWVIVVGSFCVFLALLTLRSAATFRGALTAYLMMSLGGACISTASIVLMPRAFFGPGEASASLNMGNVFFALGALIAPVLADVMLRGMGVKRSLFYLALIGLLPGILACFTLKSAGPRVQESDLFALLSEPLVLLAAAVFFLYAPLEGCLHTWVTSFLQNLGNRERDVHRLIAAFWSSFLIGRLSMAYIQHARWLPDDSERWTVLILAAAATVMLGNLAGSVDRRGAMWWLMLFGLFLGPIFPTLVGVLFEKYPSGQGTVFGTFFALGSAGSLLFAPLIAARMNRISAQNAIRIPLALGMLLLIVSFVFALWTVEG